MEKLKHTKGPQKWRVVYADKLVGVVELDICATPHFCSDPSCPGDINRRKLEAAEELADCLAGLLVADLSSKSEDWTRAERYAYAALTAWEKAGKE